MRIEGKQNFENSSENIEELLSKIDKYSRDKHNTEALELIELLPEGDDKYYKIAYIGANYVESGDLEKAQEIVDRLSQDENSIAYAGGVLELINEKNSDE